MGSVSPLLDSKLCKLKQDSILPDQICKDYKTVIASGGEHMSKQTPVYLLVVAIGAGTTIWQYT